MKINYYLKLTPVAGLLLCNSVSAQTGNYITYVEPENNRTISLDRISLETLPKKEKEAIIDGMSDELGEGKISDVLRSPGGFTHDYQQDSCGSLTGKALNVTFAPLEADADLSQSTPDDHKADAMKKLDRKESPYYVALAGVWRQSYGGESWNEPSGGYYNGNIQGCGSKEFTYNQNKGSFAFWDGYRGRWKYNVAVGFELQHFKQTAYFTELKVQTKGVTNNSTYLQSRELYKNRIWDTEFGWDGDGYPLFSYYATTVFNSQQIGPEMKVTFPIKQLKISADNGDKDVYLPEASLNWVFSIWPTFVTGYQYIKREEYVHDFGYSEENTGIEVNASTYLELKMKQRSLEVSGQIGIYYKYGFGCSSGDRDFDYYCYDGDPQNYQHSGYSTHDLNIGGSVKYKVGNKFWSVSLNWPVYNHIKPGRFYSGNAPHLRNTQLDYSM